MSCCIHKKGEENEAARMRCWSLWVGGGDEGGWVGGWVDGWASYRMASSQRYLIWERVNLTPSSSSLAKMILVLGGWVGGWLNELCIHN